jgi:heat shock protein HslJ
MNDLETTIRNAMTAHDSDLDEVPTIELAARRSGIRWSAVALVAATVAVVSIVTIGLTGRESTPAPNRSGGSVVEPPLVGTGWQLVSYEVPGGAGPIAVNTDSTIEFNGKGQFTAHACNYLGGTATISADSIAFGSLASTDMACSGEPGVLEGQLRATATGSTTWSISAHLLRLSNPDGHVLTYRVRPSIYPNLTARTIVAGDRAGGQFRLAVGGASKDNGHMYIVFEERSAPGEPWGSASIASPGPTDCLANSVLAGGSLGGQTFLATWATPEVAKVTTQRTSNSPEVALTFYDVPGSTLRIAGLWTATFRPSVSPVTFYDKNDKVIAAYPNGPC